MLCVEVLKGKMTPREIAQAYVELTFEDKHKRDFAEILKERFLLEEVENEIYNNWRVK